MELLAERRLQRYLIDKLRLIFLHGGWDAVSCGHDSCESALPADYRRLPELRERLLVGIPDVQAERPLGEDRCRLSHVQRLRYGSGDAGERELCDRRRYPHHPWRDRRVRLRARVYRCTDGRDGLLQSTDQLQREQLVCRRLWRFSVPHYGLQRHADGFRHRVQGPLSENTCRICEEAVKNLRIFDEVWRTTAGSQKPVVIGKRTERPALLIIRCEVPGEK